MYDFEDDNGWKRDQITDEDLLQDSYVYDNLLDEPSDYDNYSGEDYPEDEGEE